MARGVVAGPTVPSETQEEAQRTCGGADRTRVSNESNLLTRPVLAVDLPAPGAVCGQTEPRLDRPSRPGDEAMDVADVADVMDAELEALAGGSIDEDVGTGEHRQAAEPRTVCLSVAPQAQLARSELAEAFVAQHAFTSQPPDVLHATVTYACDFRFRLGVSWSEFPAETFVAVALPSELYGFDGFRKQIVRTLPFFFAWLSRRGDLDAADARRLGQEARGVFKSSLVKTLAVPSAPGPARPEAHPAPRESWSRAHLTPPPFATAETLPARPARRTSGR